MTPKVCSLPFISLWFGRRTSHANKHYRKRYTINMRTTIKMKWQNERESEREILKEKIKEPGELVLKTMDRKDLD